MKPKEKAIQLFDEFLSKVGTNCENDSYCDRKECQYKNRTVCGVDLFTAKQCALISVNELLFTLNEISEEDENTYSYHTAVFYNQVKTQIKKL
jgi:hypothetical protein